MEVVSAVFESIKKFLLMMRPADFIDIIIVAYILYKAIKLVRETRAEQLVKGIVVLIVTMQLSYWMQLNTLNYILRNTMQVGLVALLVVFQPELRRALEKVGRSNVGNLFVINREDIEIVVSEVSTAAGIMSADRIGALIVIERETKIGDIISTGTHLEAALTAELLVNLFIPKTPLHDGAVIVRDGKIASAACILPLTQNNTLSRELGTRHRAALGITEISDAVVVVVSEETGKISIALDGVMTRNLTVETLKKALYKTLRPEGTVNNTGNLLNWKEWFKWLKR